TAANPFWASSLASGTKPALKTATRATAATARATRRLPLLLDEVHQRRTDGIRMTASGVLTATAYRKMVLKPNSRADGGGQSPKPHRSGAGWPSSGGRAIAGPAGWR